MSVDRICWVCDKKEIIIGLIISAFIIGAIITALVAYPVHTLAVLAITIISLYLIGRRRKHK